MAKTIAQHATSAAASTGRTASKAVQAALPIEGTASYGGYWNFVAASIIMMFLLYTAQKGTIGTWIGFFGWNPQAAPTTTSAVTPVGGAIGAAVGAVNNAVNSTGLGSAITTETGLQPLTLGTTGTNVFGGTSLFGFLQSQFPSLFGSPASSNSTPVTTPAPGSNPKGGIGSA